jgi:hypothetical protein
MSGTIYRDSEQKKETLAPYSKEERKLWDKVYYAAIRSGNSANFADHTANKAVKDRREIFGKQEE